MAHKPYFASPMWNANLSLRFLHGTQTTPVFSVSLILQIFRCLVSNIRMTKLIKIIKVMRGRSQGEVKETKSLNVYLLIKIRSKILFSQLQQNLLLFLLRTPQFIQDHSKEVYRLELKQQRKFSICKMLRRIFFLKVRKLLKVALLISADLEDNF
ncbi:hypothetical protein L6452_15246 [Arctium lappa]|uniref:Uncharacterized protein n=1 Tax=Arctium lappa TaxID=4217 RepID=A0ACB9CN79_ARCLA|nr:hypothetical protein L6452_15246 [Arctium lappa]